MARARGADAIVDAAHSFGQVDVRMADIGADSSGATCTSGWVRRSASA